MSTSGAQNWRRMALKHLSRVARGASPRPIDDPKYFDDNGECAWVRIADVSASSTYLTDTTQRLSELGASLSVRIRPGELFLSIAGTVGKPCISAIEACIHDGFVYFPDLGTEYRKFLYYVFEAGEIYKGLGKFGTQLNLNTETVGGVVIDVPPPEGAIAIAKFLDDRTARIDALIAEKERLVARLKEFQYSYSSELMTRGYSPRARLVRTSFPEIGSVPEHWTVERLKFLGEVRSGVAKGKDLGDRNTVTLPYLRVANVQDGYVDLGEVLDIEVAESEASNYLLKKNDVLMNEGGDNDKLGRGTVWQGQIDPCIHQNHVFAVRLADPGLAEWVARFTSTDAARAYFFLRSKQSTNLASINQTNVLELPVPMPPPEERKTLLAEIQRSALATTNLIEHAVEHIARLREYRSSLISAAVTGQLDTSTFKVSTPTNEPEPELAA